MSYFNPTFVFGLLLILYLGSFVIFAILRIATGISIQRVGYFSLRRIAYVPREGIRIDIRGLGLVLHRPTFAQPTWISLRLTGFKITIDFKTLGRANEHGRKHRTDPVETSADPHLDASQTSEKPKSLPRLSETGPSRGRLWRRLTQTKERIKKLHDKIQWICLVDIEALNSTCVITDVGSFELGTLSVAVDTRRKTVDRGRLFQHKKVPAGDQRPVEWIFTLKSLLFTPEGQESLEVLDICTLNIHGLLYKNLAGLRDASVSLKLGRIHIPYDDLLHCKNRIEQCRNTAISSEEEGEDIDISITDLVEELDRPGSREAEIVQTVSDSKDFISSILRGIQEIQMAISFVGLTKAIDSIKPSSNSLFVNVAMNEFGIDMYRLDPKSPAHRMYFSSKDIAHQALLAGISIGLSLDDGSGKPQRILYVPMATMTVKTTLPSKTVAFSEDQNAAERNANILFSNLVVTSPSVDVDPNHMPLLLAISRVHRGAKNKKPYIGGHRHHLISRLLPKAVIKLSIHEPVLRVSLPPADPKLKFTDEYDLLVCSTSSASLDVESSHSSAGELHYALTSNLRISSNHLYYHTASGERHNLLLTDNLELKVQVSVSPEVSVIASGNVQTFSVHMVRPEISGGVRQIMQQLSKRPDDKFSRHARAGENPNFLRPLPPWLVNFQLQGSNFGINVADTDPEISEDMRGISLQLESWTAEYKNQRDAEIVRPPSRRRGAGKSSVSGETSIKITPPLETPLSGPNSTNGRRLAIHVRGFEGFVIEGINTTESESLISLPRFEIAFSSAADSRGPVFHINSYIRASYLQYSLYRYYAVGMAFTVLRRTFFPNHHYSRPHEHPVQPFADIQESAKQPLSATDVDLVSIDVKAELFQIKTTMPSDPPMMLQIFGIEAGRHRWAAPFIKSRLVRLYTDAPQIPSVWARIATIKNLRVDQRESKRKSGRHVVEERSVDITTEFVRLGVPHQLVLHKVFDNFANVLKATEQLHHRFITGTNEYILKKVPEGPKVVPRISIRSKAFLFELEDGPFEWKLSSIYRTGLHEQKQRLARQEAFVTKLRNMEELQQHRGSSRLRSHQTHSPRRDMDDDQETGNSHEESRDTNHWHRGRTSSPSGYQAHRWRYDPEGKCGLTGSAKISAEEAWVKLQRYNAQSWKKRIDAVYQIQSVGMRDIRAIFWGNNDIPDLEVMSERVLAIPERPGLMSALISDLHVIIDKPSFLLKDYAQFLHKIGKGMPKDMEYTLLIPMNVQIDMGEARITLRDYPLPLLHVPAIRPGQSPRLPSWSLKTDFIIAEEFRGDESTKTVKVEVIPPAKFSDPKVKGGFLIDVRRTVSPVKTYSDVEIAINTSAPTSITWGTSYQPAIQDMMMIIEGFTKPQIDPSDRTGFWDKIRLAVHSRVNVAWKGDGDVHLKLKGARDPYVVTGHGAGFVMCWRSNVRWGIHQSDDPKRFMTVTSGEYVLAIPDYSHQARERNSSGQDNESISSSGSYKNGAMFKKVVMKLSGNVRWMAGLVFERDLDQGGRSFEFLPHYEVTLRTPEKAMAYQTQNYDAYKGFRSNHIHLSIAVAAPLDRDWTKIDAGPSLSYNTVHLTPRFFTHFFDWWSLFSGAMSLPVRQGTLFPGIEKASKKFGRHLATIKYNLLLSPLFTAHVYKHKDAEDYAEDLLSATGLKLRLDSFVLDLHQRREEFIVEGKGRGKQIKTSAMRINEAQLDFISADVRAISASIAGTTSEAVKNATEEELASYQEPTLSDMSRFTIPDNDFSWIDMDDYVELDWILPAETNPETKIMPLAYAPRFTYFRQTDHVAFTSEETKSPGSFCHDPTHFCVMSQDNDPRRVQCKLIQERLAKIDEQLEMHKRTLGEQELRVIRDGNRDGGLKERFQLLSEQGGVLEGKKEYLKAMFARLNRRLDENKPWKTPFGDSADHDLTLAESSDYDSDHGENGIEDASFSKTTSDFNNRFIIHNAQFKWNNSLRNIILRYVHQVGQRRGFVYYMSQRAVKFILDIVDEQKKSKHVRRSSFTGDKAEPEEQSEGTSGNENFQDSNVEDRIQQLLNDAKRFVDANDPAQAEATEKSNTYKMDQDISQGFTPVNSYHLRLVAPQFQLQSEKNAKSVLLVTAKSMQLKIIQIMDKDRMTDDVSGLVQRRFSANMDSVQFFVTSQKNLMQFVHLYSGNRYGTPKGSAWPPWVPFEVNYDFELNPFGFSRVVQRTSASLRYEKYNTLRLKFNDEINSGKDRPPTPENIENRIDHLWVDFPRVRAICDSSQYYAMYVIVIDLLLYTEPLEKVRSEKLEKIMLASDFSDLRGAPEMVTSLQRRLRQLQEIKTYFQIYAKYLDRQGWQDRLSVEQDMANCEDELFFMMKALTTSQRKSDDRGQASQTNGLRRWYLSASEIVWQLVKDKNEPLIEIQLQNAAYDRTDNIDGSNHNAMEIGNVHGLNLLPNAIYPEMLAPFFEPGKRFTGGQNLKMLKVKWHMLEAIAGIPVLDQFEVNLFPLKVQLEREVGKQVFDYIFPAASSNGENGGFSPLMVRHMQSPQDGDGDSDSETQRSISETNTYEGTGSSDDQHSSTRPGSLEMRLRPTRAFPEHSRPKSGGSSGNGDTHHFRLFHHSNHPPTLSKPGLSRKVVKKISKESLRSNNLSSHNASSTSLSAVNGSTDRHKKFTLNRARSRDTIGDKEKDKKPSDDLTQMMARASNYMTLAYVKIPSVVLCLSYKGRGERNIEDLHDFVFRMPILEYRNKTWSNLDLALRLKKDVIKALISHTGAIIGNKFSHHRPTKQQTSRLRELANSSSLLPSSNTFSTKTTTSDTNSMFDRSPSTDRADSPFTFPALSSRNAKLARTESFPSSTRSSMLYNGPFYSEPSSIPESLAESNDDHSYNFMRKSFTRRFTNDTLKNRHKEAAVAEDSEETTRKKSVLLLGRKILGSLN